MKGWREHAADVFTEPGAIAAKMKSAPGPVPRDFRGLSPEISDYTKSAAFSPLPHMRELPASPLCDANRSKVN